MKNLIAAKPLFALTALALALQFAIPGPVHAQSTPVVINMPAQPLGQALTELAAKTGLLIGADAALVSGKTAPALNGSYAPEQALQVLLTGSGLSANKTGNKSYTLRPQSDAQLPEVNVVAEGDPTAPYAGGQVARGGRLGLFGNRDLFDVPFTVVPYTRELIDNQQARTMVQVIANDPSITIAQNTNSAGADDVFYIRGFLAASTGASTYDGLANVGGRSQAIEGIERIELLKGPTAFLNGAPGLVVGGTINFVPKRAEAAPLNRVTARYFSDSVFGLHGDIGRRFGENKQFGARANVAYNDGDTALDINKKRNKVATLALDYQGETVRLWGDFEYSSIFSRGFLGGTTIAAGITVPDAPRNTNNWGQPWSTYPQQKRRALVRGEWDFVRNWTATIAHGRFDQTDGPFPTCRPNITSTAGTLSIVCSTGGGLNDADSTEISVRGHFETGSLSHRLALGITDANQEGFSAIPASSVAVVLPGNVGSNIYNPIYYPKPVFPAVVYAGKTSDTAIRTLFIGDEIGLFNDQLLVTLGGRRIELDARNFNATTGVQTQRFDKHAFTPAAGVVFKVQPNVSLYGNYAEALEQGGIAPLTAANAGEVLEPLLTRQIEGGVKTDFGRLALTVGAFRIAKANTLLVNNVFGNNGQQVNRGLEVSLFGELMPSLRILSGFTWLRAEQTKTAAGVFDGKDAIGIPRQQARLGLEWDTPSISGFTLTGEVAHSTKSFVDAGNTQRIPGWTRLDLGARYAFKAAGYATTARLNIENVADRDYWGSVDRGNLYLAQPRTISVSFTTDF